MPVSAWAQEGNRQLVVEMREAFQNLNYDRAEQLADSILSRYDGFLRDELIETHVTLALIQYAQNRQREAELQFVSALSLNPELELDPMLVSPKVRTFFEDIKETRQLRMAEGEERVEPRYIFVRDPRPAAAVRSMIVPGWGQFYKEEPVKGYVFAGAWVGTAGASFIAHIRRQDAATAYRQATDPTEIMDRYQTYNRTHKFRNAMLVTSAAVWLVSYVDALVSDGEPALQSDNRPFSFSVHPTSDFSNGEIQVRIRF